LAAATWVLLLFRLWEGSMGNPRGQAPCDSFPGLVAGVRTLRLSLIILANLAGLLAHPHAAAQQNAKNVVVLSGGRGRDSLNRMESSLRSHVKFPVNFSIVDLDNPRFDEKSYQDNLAEALQAAYGKKPDLLFACMDPSLRFAGEYRDQIFPGVPVVFMSVSTLLADKQIWPGVTGVAVPSGARQTVDLALHLHPDTTAVAVISGDSENEEDYLAAVHSELLHHQDKVTEIDIVGPPSGRMLERVAALPPHTVVLFQLIPHDSEQRAIEAYDVLATVTQRFPTYSVFGHLALEHGGIGGFVYDARDDAVLAGEIAARVLSGEQPDKIPIQHLSNSQNHVDWGALRRWNISESALPPGTVVLNRELTLWQRYRGYILAAIFVIVAQALLIAALLWQRARKRKAEAVLRESEERFRLLANTTPALIWMCDAEGTTTYLNERRFAFTGSDQDAGYGDTWMTYIHPHDLPAVKEAFSKAIETRQPYTKEFRLRRRDGTYRWMFDVASPRLNDDGTFAGFIGSAIDITDQRIARQALQRLSGQLIRAQEKERTRIARELHDDICQRLALLSVELGQASRSSNGASSKLDEIRKHCSDIAGDVQALSHRLHSSKLDFLGIAAALKSFCDEFSRQHELTVEFIEKDVPANLPQDAALCLFRVTQEALQNAVKYSETRSFAVELTGTQHEVRLEVKDWGAGFDVEAARRNHGLGLVSMRERVHLVHGSFSIESRPGEGTKIVVVLPLFAEGELSSGAEAATKAPG
jgi:PAS domain S-box-containing protein